MLILAYISTHGTPEWCAALRECQPGSPRVAYRRMSNPVHHAQARVGSTHTGPRDAAPSLISVCCNVCGGPIRRRHIPSVV